MVKSLPVQMGRKENGEQDMTEIIVLPEDHEEVSEYVSVLFSINEYDRDGDLVATGIFLHFDNTRVKVADDLKSYGAFIQQLVDMKEEITDTWRYING